MSYQLTIVVLHAVISVIFLEIFVESREKLALKVEFDDGVDFADEAVNDAEDGVGGIEIKLSPDDEPAVNANKLNEGFHLVLALAFKYVVYSLVEQLHHLSLRLYLAGVLAEVMSDHVCELLDCYC